VRAYVVAQLVKAMTKKRVHIDGAKVLVIGLAFKENCPDLRNTREVDVVAELKDYNFDVDVYDPWVTVEEAFHGYGITPIIEPKAGSHDAIILDVVLSQFRNMGNAVILALRKPTSVLYGLKYVLTAQESDLRL